MLTTCKALLDEKKGEKWFPGTLKKRPQGNATKIAESREETYFTLLINIYSLNLFQAVI
jgi:hypothetical protein